MKGVYSLCVFLALLVVVASSTELPRDILSSHHDGRSGDILLYSKQSNPVLGSVSFTNAQKFPSTEGSIPETSVADLITHFNGLAPFQPNRDRSSFPPSNFFSKPKANLFFYFQNPSSFPLSPLSNSQSFPLQRESSYSSDSTLSQLTTIYSGVSPSTHGIISDSFVDRTHKYASSSVSRAFDSWTLGVAYSANLADLWTLSFKGQSLVLSFSASKPVSRALNAKPIVLETSVSGNYGFYMSSASKTAEDNLESIYDNTNNKKPLINKEHIKAFLNGVAPCGLSFEDPIDFGLISELAVPMMLMQDLNAPGSEFAKYTTDEIPDLYSFGFTSLKAFGAKHGLTSANMQCAVSQVDKTISSVYQSLSAVYTGPDAVLTEVVSVNLETPPSDKLTVAGVVKSAFKGLVESNRTIVELLPHVYLNEVFSADKVQILTDRLNKALESKGLRGQVEAVQLEEPKFESHYQAYELVKERRAETGNNTITNAGVLHTCLWTGVFLGVSILGGAYFMFGVDASSDPVLYQHDINHPQMKG